MSNSVFLGFVLLHNPRHNDKNDGHDGNCIDHLSRHLQPAISTKFIYVFFDFLINLTIAAHIKGKETKIKRPIMAINSFHLIVSLQDFILHTYLLLNTKPPAERNVQLAARPCFFFLQNELHESSLNPLTLQSCCMLLYFVSHLVVLYNPFSSLPLKSGRKTYLLVNNLLFATSPIKKTPAKRHV